MDASMFKRIRMGLGLSQAEMAERIGCSLNYVQQAADGGRFTPHQLQDGSADTARFRGGRQGRRSFPEDGAGD